MPDQPLVRIAAKVSGEPNLYLEFFCCARSQQKNRHDCIIFGSAAQRENQPFKHAAAKSVTRFHRSPDLAAVHRRWLDEAKPPQDVHYRKWTYHAVRPDGYETFDQGG
jgi:hypothetical protein